MAALRQKIKLLYFRLFRNSYKKKLLGFTSTLPEFRLLAAFLQKNPLLFIDVGANKGEFVYLAEKILPSEKIIAVEPLPWFAQKLKILFPNVRVINSALAQKTAQTTIYVPVKNGVPDDALTSLTKPGSGEFHSYEVQVDTLASLTKKLGLNEPCFLKIDVEGHEFDVIRGGEEFIMSHVQLMLVEIEERHHAGRSLAEMIASVEEMGFAAYYLNPANNQLHRFSASAPPLQKKEDLNTVFYINNFWFFAKQFPHQTVVPSLNQGAL